MMPVMRTEEEDGGWLEGGKENNNKEGESNKSEKQRKFH
jgi:hypothetical protein